MKAIFFDIDGTLLSFRTHRVCETTEAALHQLREKGIKLFIATGRTPSELGYLGECLDFEFDGYVSMNGQYCYSKDQIIHEKKISKESIRRTLEYIEQHKVSCCFVERDYAFLNFETPELAELREMFGGTALREPIDDPKRSLVNDTYQMSILLQESQEADFFKKLPDCKSARWHPKFTDIIPVDGGKPEGIRRMLKHFGIPTEECMAFGDGGNDVEMLQFAQIGVAMGNAIERVKEAADFVTRDVDEDGIAYALKHFGLI